MKKFYFIFVLAALLFCGCKTNHIIYEGPEYIAFAEKQTVCPVQQNGTPFSIMISSTRACDYDRTIGVEVLSMKSNAVYGYHYRLESQTVTIPAGELAASVNIIGNYERIAPTDSLSLTLKLVAPEDTNWPLLGQETQVLLKKTCPFDIYNFEGYCLVASDYLIDFAVSPTGDRLVKSEVYDADRNIIRLKDFYYEGYDVLMQFDVSDILHPRIKMLEEQMIADTRLAFNMIYGDCRLLGDDYDASQNTLDVCQKYATQMFMIRVDEVGVVGNYENQMEWLTEEEARDYI